MPGDGAKWEGLLKWSLAHSDGTRPARNLSEEDRRWFMEGMQSQTVDVKRMKEITLVMRTLEDVLESQGITAADILGKVGGICRKNVPFTFILYDLYDLYEIWVPYTT